MSLKIEKIKTLLLKDKRKTERLFLPIKVFYSEPGESKWRGPIPIEDIGGGGLKLKDKKRIKRNTELNLKINLPDESKPILLKGEVVWCKRGTPKNAYSMGVKFHKMNCEDRKKYVSYICKKILFEYLSNEGEKIPKGVR